MKLVREHMNEKFIEDSDPIEDMNIGLKGMIKKWCVKHNIKNFRINNDFTIDVINDQLRYYNQEEEYKEGINRSEIFINSGRVDIIEYPDEELPEYIQFNIVEGYFAISSGKLKTLRGCPRIVYDNFWCEHNNLTTLDYCPKEVRGSFICHHNAKYFDKDYIQSKCKTERKRIQN